MLILTRADVQRLIRMQPIIAAVEAAHAALARGEASQSIDEATSLSNGAVMLPMAAAITPRAAAGVKLLTDVPANHARSLPSQSSTIIVVDPVTGRCRGFLDGIEITRYRTAAASAVATRYLARHAVKTLGLIGAGAQAHSHLLALTAVREFERVIVWSRSRSTAELFAAHHAARGVPIAVLDTPEAVVRSADVLCTLTPSREPLVCGDWFTPGLHVNAVGSPPRRDHREIDTRGITRSLVVVDDLATALSRSGEICIPLADGDIGAEHIHADLGQVIVKARAGRTSDEQITLFNSVGLAIQDIATASHILDIAEAEGVGLELDLSASERRDDHHYSL
ncbi:MAG: ornithine cyclodeaminase family protein [Solirubrobacteraceae bacterium]